MLEKPSTTVEMTILPPLISLARRKISEMVAGDALIAMFRGELPHVRWADLSRRGYLVVSFTAARMRTYVPQRHRLSESAVRICASLGLGLLLRSAAVVMTMPLMQ